MNKVLLPSEVAGNHKISNFILEARVVTIAFLHFIFIKQRCSTPYSLAEKDKPAEHPLTPNSSTLGKLT